jgi:hypothetical protein
LWIEVEVSLERFLAPPPERFGVQEASFLVGRRGDRLVLLSQLPLALPDPSPSLFTLRLVNR